MITDDRPYSKEIFEALRDHVSAKVTAPLLRAMIRVESGYNPRATRTEPHLLRGKDLESVAMASSHGLTQMLGSTAKHLGMDWRELYDPLQSIRAGMNYLEYCLRSEHDNVRLALSCYNQGPRKSKKTPYSPAAELHAMKVLATMAEEG